jgi:hypothetical protein
MQTKNKISVFTGKYEIIQACVSFGGFSILPANQLKINAKLKIA